MHKKTKKTATEKTVAVEGKVILTPFPFVLLGFELKFKFH